MRAARLLATFVALVLSLAALAQSPYPNKPVTLIVPYPPGGATDVVARVIGEKLGTAFGQPVIVENKSGANGAIGSEFVAKAPPDGYTILFGYIATHGINPGLSKLPYDAVKDFAPIAQISEAPIVLVVNPSLPAKTVQELIALAKAKPGSISYASAGNGTAPHIAAELFKQMTGVDMVHVPYKGSSPALTDTLSGQTQVMFPSLVAASGHMKSGKLRGLAISGKARSPLFPSLPTVSEAGVKGFEITQWYGFFAPAKTPKEIVDRLNQEIVAVMNDPETKAKFAAQGADIVTSSPEAFGNLVQSEIAKWRQLIKTAKITAD